MHTPDTKSRFFGIAAAMVATAYAAYQGMADDVKLGNILFSVFIAVLLLLKELSYTPGFIVEKVRYFFRYGDNIARYLVLILAVCGTAWAIDLFYDLDPLPEWLDVWIKRLGPAFLFTAIVLFTASVVSNAIYALSEIEKDLPTQKLEIPYYFLCVSLCTILTFLFLGYPVEKHVPSKQGEDFSTTFTWSTLTLKFIITCMLVNLIWLSAVFFCLISRFLEWKWRISKSVENRGV